MRPSQLCDRQYEVSAYGRVLFGEQTSLERGEDVLRACGGGRQCVGGGDAHFGVGVIEQGQEEIGVAAIASRAACTDQFCK